VATDLVGNSSPEPLQVQFVSPDATPPQLSASLLWGSVHALPALKSCEAAFVFTSNELVNVTYVATDSVAQQWPLFEISPRESASPASSPAYDTTNEVLLSPLSETELQQVALLLVGNSGNVSSKHAFPLSPEVSGFFQDSSGLHVHLRLAELPCGAALRLLAVAEDASGNIGKRAVEVKFATPDVAAPVFLNSTPHAAVVHSESSQKIAVDLVLSEPATIACAVMNCFVGIHSQAEHGALGACSHVPGAASGSLLQQSISNVPGASRMWTSSINTTVVHSALQRHTLVLKAELVSSNTLSTCCPAVDFPTSTVYTSSPTVAQFYEVCVMAADNRCAHISCDHSS
jgi:hypothetical protein